MPGEPVAVRLELVDEAAQQAGVAEPAAFDPKRQPHRPHLGPARVTGNPLADARERWQHSGCPPHRPVPVELVHGA